MSNPLETIETGIINGDWVTVCRGYESLTGKIIKTKGISLLSDKLIKQIEELINNYYTTIILDSKNRIDIHHSDIEKIEKNKDPIIFDNYKTVPGNKNKPGYYGNITKPLTENVPEEEINKNIEKATITKERKTKRNPPKKYDVKCSQCEKNFESDRQESKDFGQKCPKCLQDTINGRIVE